MLFFPSQLFPRHGQREPDYESPNGVFTLSGYSTQAANFKNYTSFIAIYTAPQINTAAGGRNTVSFWMYWSGTSGQFLGFINYGLSLRHHCLVSIQLYTWTMSME